MPAGASVVVRSSSTDDINLVADSGRRLLRSAVDRTCVIPRTHNTYGDKSFTAAVPRLWNSLPSNLQAIIYVGTI